MTSPRTVPPLEADERATLTAFLDGIDKPEAREEGTAWMLDNLGKYLAAQAGS